MIILPYAYSPYELSLKNTGRIIMSWQKRLPGAFGEVDQIFAGHPSDAERAKDLMWECFKNNVPLNDVLDEARKHLTSKNAGEDHIQEQLKDIKEKLKGWLS